MLLIYIGSDHQGFKLKESLKNYLANAGYEIVDVGNVVYDGSDDYPDFAVKVAKEVSADPLHRRGVLVCGSGVGVDVVANKFPGVRSVLAMSPDHAFISRTDDDTNVLSLGAAFVEEDEAKKILSVWLQASFSGEERHRRRLEKIRQLEIELKNEPSS